MKNTRRDHLYVYGRVLGALFDPCAAFRRGERTGYSPVGKFGRIHERNSAHSVSGLLPRPREQTSHRCIKNLLTDHPSVQMRELPT